MTTTATTTTTTTTTAARAATTTTKAMITITITITLTLFQLGTIVSIVLETLPAQIIAHVIRGLCDIDDS